MARILAKISQGELTVEAVYSEALEKFCSGCRNCNPVCPYGAVEFDAEKNVSRIISAVCKACGCCAVAFPSGGSRRGIPPTSRCLRNWRRCCRGIDDNQMTRKRGLAA